MSPKPAMQHMLTPPNRQLYKVKGTRIRAGNKDRTLHSNDHGVKKPSRATRQWRLRLPLLVRRIALLTEVFGVLHHFHDVNGGRGTHSRASSCRTGTYRHHAGHVTVAVITAVARMMKIWRIFLSSQRRWCSQASGSRRHRLFWGSVRAIRLSIATSYSSLPKIFLEPSEGPSRAM